MGCPVCGKYMCDHSPSERGQTMRQMMSDSYSTGLGGRSLYDGPSPPINPSLNEETKPKKVRKSKKRRGE